MRSVNTGLLTVRDIALGSGSALIVVIASVSCAQPDHGDPEKDLPVIMGDTVDAPWGCMLWVERSKSVCCYLDETAPDEWTLPNGWDC